MSTGNITHTGNNVRVNTPSVTRPSNVSNSSRSTALTKQYFQQLSEVSGIEPSELEKSITETVTTKINYNEAAQQILHTIGVKKNLSISKYPPPPPTLPLSIARKLTSLAVQFIDTKKNEKTF